MKAKDYYTKWIQTDINTAKTMFEFAEDYHKYKLSLITEDMIMKASTVYGNKQHQPTMPTFRKYTAMDFNAGVDWLLKKLMKEEEENDKPEYWEEANQLAKDLNKDLPKEE